VSRWGKPEDMIALLGSYELGKKTLLNCFVDNSQIILSQQLEVGIISTDCNS
jgi:hypothetical protein